jgi:hypothetical protein
LSAGKSGFSLVSSAMVKLHYSWWRALKGGYGEGLRRCIKVGISVVLVG